MEPLPKIKNSNKKKDRHLRYSKDFKSIKMVNKCFKCEREFMAVGTQDNIKFIRFCNGCRY